MMMSFIYTGNKRNSICTVIVQYLDAMLYIFVIEERPFFFFVIGYPDTRMIFVYIRTQHIYTEQNIVYIRNIFITNQYNLTSF